MEGLGGCGLTSGLHTANPLLGNAQQPPKNEQPNTPKDAVHEYRRSGKWFYTQEPLTWNVADERIVRPHQDGVERCRSAADPAAWDAIQIPPVGDDGSDERKHEVHSRDNEHPHKDHVRYSCRLTFDMSGGFRLARKLSARWKG
jgi:hypothetical protein